MPSKKNQDQDHAQRERFEQAARELGVELNEEKLKDALRRMRYDDTSRPDGEHDHLETKK